MGFDEIEASFSEEIAEMNRQKCWLFHLGLSWQSPPESVKVENGKISFIYKLEGNILDIAKLKQDQY